MGHNRKVLVLKTVNYGASKASATQNTALNPIDLADGAVGVYGIHEVGATNLNKTVLLTDGGSEVAGAVPAASFVGKEVFIAQGTVTDCRLSNPIRITPARGIVRSGGLAYTAPVRGEIRIGYNGTSGLLNLPATINRGDDFIISLLNRNFATAGYQEPGQKVILSVQTLAASESQLQILTRFVSAINKRTDDIQIAKNSIRILHNGTGAVFTTSATVAGVNGATTLTTSAAHGVTAGDAISLNGDYYVTIAGTTGSTLVLNRPFQGPTGVISNANTLDISGAATQFGLAFADARDFMNQTVALQGLAQNATITYQTPATQGSGSNAEVVALELDALGKKGTEDQITSYIPKDIIYSRAAGANQNYDLYFLEVRNINHSEGHSGSVFGVLNYLTLAFPSGVADTTNFNQSDFEDIMQSLFTTALVPSIS